MINEIDKRNFEVISSLQKEERHNGFAAKMNETASVNILDINNISAFTGTPETILNDSDDSHQSLISAGLNYLQSISPMMGFNNVGEVEFIPDPHITTTSGGSTVIHYGQYYRGIPLFQMGRSVHFSANNQIKSARGNSIYITEEIELLPQLDVKAAFEFANKYINDNKMDVFVDSWGLENKVEFSQTADYKPSIVASYNLPAQPTVLAQGPFGSAIPAHLVIFYTGETYRLGWYYTINMEEPLSQFDTIVSADNKEKPEVLYFHETTKYHPQAQGKVYRFSGKQNRIDVTFPVNINELGVEPNGSLPNGFPEDWIDNDQTMGNNTIAVLGNTTDTLQGSKTDNVIKFAPNDPMGDDQKVLNIFYFCNVMHNFFYLLGFDEAAGNFQRINFNLGGAGNDCVIARAHSGAIYGVANMRTPVDGNYPEMNMGLFSDTGNHTALDSDVVFHEFVHGVTNRLVGGRYNSRALEMKQSGGMGEGWSDYFALSFRNYFFNNEKVVSGDWVTGREGGIRSHPYNDNYPATYGSIGEGRYTGVHAIGEIWCATLMHMTRNLSEHLGKHEGYNLIWQILVDGLKLTAPNPSFLDARNAIIQALEDMIAVGNFKTLLNREELERARGICWESFAKFGMGINARSNSAGLTGIQEDFTTP